MTRLLTFITKTPEIKKVSLQMKRDNSKLNDNNVMTIRKHRYRLMD